MSPDTYDGAVPHATTSDHARRILIYGVTGSGKSTAAARIGAATGKPVTLVDELMWLPGWVPVEVDEQRRMIEPIVAEPSWVLDSSYSHWLDLVLPSVDLVVGLDYPRWFSLQRLLRRTVRRVVTRQETCNGNVETWRQLFSNDSILLWHFRSFTRKRDRIRAWAAAETGPAVLRFRSTAELDRWISDLATGRDEPSAAPPR